MQVLSFFYISNFVWFSDIEEMNPCKRNPFIMDVSSIQYWFYGLEILPSLNCLCWKLRKNLHWFTTKLEGTFCPNLIKKNSPFVWGSTEVTTMSLGDFVLWLLGFPSLYTAQIRGMTLSSSFHSASNQVVINPIRLAESVIDFSIPGTSN